MQHAEALPCFERFQIQQSTGLSVESIDSSHRHFLSVVNNQGFCKQLSSYTKVAIFSSNHWAGLSPFLVALSILRVASPAQRKCRWVNESESNEECHCLDWSWRFGNVFKLSSSLSTWFCTWMNLPNVARYGREISNVHQCHLRAVINVAISIKYYFNKILIIRAWSVCTEDILPSVFAQTSCKISLFTDLPLA